MWRKDSSHEARGKLEIMKAWGVSQSAASLGARQERQNWIGDDLRRELEDCANDGELGAHLLMGTLDLLTTDGSARLEDAERHFRLALTEKSGLAELGLSATQLRQNHASESSRLIRRAIKRHGDVDEYLIGYLFWDGRIFVRDVPNAVKWFEKAANKDDWRAMASLSYLYATGIGVKKDATRAAELQRRAEAHPLYSPPEINEPIVGEIKPIRR